MFQVNGFVRQSATRHFGPKQPSLDKGVPIWLLLLSLWNDNGRWVDSQTWMD